MSFKTKDEIWNPVVNYEGLYEVSNLGNVRSIRRLTVDKIGREFIRKGRNLKLYLTKAGYFRVELSRDNIQWKESVHRLVAEAFISNEEGLPYVNHLNLIKTDNRANNLEWCTPRQNIQHAVDNGALKARPGEQCNFSTLKETQVVEIVSLLKEGKLLQREIASKFGVTESAISSINTGNGWNYLTGNYQDKNLREKEVINCRGETFSSMAEAAKKFGIDKSNISKVCAGVQLSAGKYSDKSRVKWRILNHDCET